MNKFEQIKKCFSNIQKCAKFWVGYYSLAMILITAHLISAMIKNNMGDVIFYFIFFLITGAILLVDINDQYWPHKNTDKTKE
jgi:hypothetical protein